MKKLIFYILFTVIAITTILITYNIELTNAEEVYPINGMVSVDAVVVHNAPNTNSSSAITELVYGTRVTVVSKSGSYYYIKYTGGEGYVAPSCIKNVDANTLTTSVEGKETYDNYCHYLETQGFPSSYCPYLYFLHVKHPNWVFKADQTGMTLTDAGIGEEGKCALQTSNQNYWLAGYSGFECSTSSSCYYYIKRNVISTIMDPRNSLYEDLIFQFFDSDDNKDLMSDNTINYLVGDGNLKKYTATFNQAASTYGINVVQLVSRSSQEGANNPNYVMIRGSFTTDTGNYYKTNNLDGYYNFYNIGASGAKIDGTSYTAQTMGMAYAASYFNPETTSFQRPWNTPEKAILGGAEFLTKAYIAVGQDTAYYQKFNVGSRSSNKYTNQYMTNSNAPAAEGSKMYSTFKNSNSLDLGFVFTIPVYNNMGDIFQAVDKDSNSKLKAVYINGTLLQGFDKEVTEPGPINYQTASDTITVTAEAESSTTKITGTGEYTFSGGIINIVITAVAEDGSSTIYKYQLNQIKNGEKVISVDSIVNNIGVKINGNIMYGISPGTDASTLINTVVKNSGNTTIKNSSGVVKTSGNLATGDTITINGTYESKTYTISVRGDTSGDGLVKINDLILVQSHILGKASLTGEKFYAGDLNYDGASKINDLVMIQSFILGKIIL